MTLVKRIAPNTATVIWPIITKTASPIFITFPSFHNENPKMKKSFFNQMQIVPYLNDSMSISALSVKMGNGLLSIPLSTKKRARSLSSVDEAQNNETLYSATDVSVTIYFFVT